MAGAKKLVTLSFILVPAGAVRPAGGCSGHYVAVHRGAYRAGLQVRRERRLVLQVPKVLIEVGANIVVKAESVQVSVVCHPLRLGDCLSFYWPRRKQFTSVPYYSSYMWRHGVQCHGVDSRLGESCFWRDIMVRLVRVQEQLQWWRLRGCPFEGRPREDSRVSLTCGRTGHSGRRGGALSPHAYTVSGMVMQ
jgi:hypothetical protein